MDSLLFTTSPFDSYSGFFAKQVCSMCCSHFCSFYKKMDSLLFTTTSCVVSVFIPVVFLEIKEAMDEYGNATIVRPYGLDKFQVHTDVKTLWHKKGSKENLRPLVFGAFDKLTGIVTDSLRHRIKNDKIQRRKTKAKQLKKQIELEAAQGHDNDNASKPESKISEEELNTYDWTGREPTDAVEFEDNLKYYQNKVGYLGIRVSNITLKEVCLYHNLGKDRLPYLSWYLKRQEYSSVTVQMIIDQVTAMINDDVWSGLIRPVIKRVWNKFKLNRKFNLNANADFPANDDELRLTIKYWLSLRIDENKDLVYFSLDMDDLKHCQQQPLDNVPADGNEADTRGRSACQLVAWYNQMGDDSVRFLYNLQLFFRGIFLPLAEILCPAFLKDLMDANKDYSLHLLTKMVKTCIRVDVIEKYEPKEDQASKATVTLMHTQFRDWLCQLGAIEAVRENAPRPCQLACFDYFLAGTHYGNHRRADEHTFISPMSCVEGKASHQFVHYMSTLKNMMHLTFRACLSGKYAETSKSKNIYPADIVSMLDTLQNGYGRFFEFWKFVLRMEDFCYYGAVTSNIRGGNQFSKSIGHYATNGGNTLAPMLWKNASLGKEIGDSVSYSVLVTTQQKAIAFYELSSLTLVTDNPYNFQTDEHVVAIVCAPFMEGYDTLIFDEEMLNYGEKQAAIFNKFWQRLGLPSCQPKNGESIWVTMYENMAQLANHLICFVSVTTPLEPSEQLNQWLDDESHLFDKSMCILLTC